MANMREVNKAIKQAFPNLDVRAVRSDGYVYYDGKDGFGKIESLFCNPSTTPTEDMTRIVLEDINNVYGE